MFPSEMKRKFKLTIITEVDTETLKEGLDKAREDFKMFSVIDVKPVMDIRTLNQNSALHKYFELIEDEAREKGLTMDMLIKKPSELPITRHLLKDFFRFIGKMMFHKDSTAKLNKHEFNEIQKTFEKTVAERLEISIPFPSYENDDRGF